MKHHIWKAAAGMLSLLALAGVFSGCGSKEKLSVTTAAQLNDSAYTIGVSQGASGQIVVEREYPNAEIKYYTKDADAYLAVQQGKIDAFVYDRVSMEFAIADGLTGVKLLEGNIGDPIDIAVGISRRSSIPDLQPKINEFIAQLQADGTLKDMLRRWVYEAEDTIPDIKKPENPALTIKVGTTGIVQPFSYYKGDQLCGYDIELIQRFALWMNAEVEISTYDYDGIASAAESGSIDCIIANLNVTEERKPAILFSDTIYKSSNAVMVQESGTSAETPDRVPVETARIGVMDGSTNEIYAEEHYPDADRQNFKNYVDSCAALSAGKLDYAMMDYTNALRFTRGYPDLQIASEFLTDEKLCIGVSRNKTELYAEVSEVMNRFLADGTVDTAIEHWIRPDGSDYEAPETPRLSDAPEIRVAIVSSREPTTFIMNEQFAGLDIEIIDRILYELGYRAEYVDMEWGAVVAAIESGKADMTLGMYNTPERAEKLLFTEPYFTNPQLLVARRTQESSATVESRVPLEKADFGVMTGSTAEVYLADTYPLAKISTFTSIADALTALSNGKADYVMTAYTTSLGAVRLNPSLEIYQKDVVMESSAIAVSKEKPELLAQLNAALSQFRADGTLKKIASHWTTEGKDYVREPRPVASGKNGVLRVAVSADREPMCFIMDGQYEGLDCELIERIAYEMDMTVEYQNMQFSSLVAALVSDKADVIISNMTPTEERSESVSFTETYFDNPQVLVARKPNDTLTKDGEGQYTSLSQMRGKNLACITGSIFDQLTLSVIPDAQFSYYNNATDELTALRAGKVEGIPTDGPVAELWLALNSDLAVISEPVVEDQYGVAFAKGSSLTEDFNRELKVLKETGVLDEMYAKWLSADDSKKTLPSLTYPAPNGTLRVACSVALEPMCYAGSDGVPLGLEVEMVLRIAQVLGKKVELTSVDFGGLIPMLQSGKADVAVGCISISDERSQMVDFASPHYDGGMFMVVRRASDAAVENTGFWAGLEQSFIRTFVTENRWKLVLNGLMVTVVLSVCSGLLGSVLGFGICMLRRSKRRLASIPAAVFIRIIQGTPIVVLLMILYYIIFGRLDISAILVAILGFAVNFGVYVSEMIRTGIDAVDKGQIEAAYALGFTRVRTFWKITFPQAARHFLPVFKGEFISMVKMTSVVGYIAIQDLTKVSDIIRSRTLEAFFPLIATAVLYFIVANLLTILLSRLEIRLDPKRRKRAVKGVVMK